MAASRSSLQVINRDHRRLADMRPVAPDPASTPLPLAQAPPLPTPLTRFIGREREVAEIAALLDTTRLLTLTGSGGCGKTRLALQVTTGRAAASPDGVRFVALAALADPALVPHTAAAALGIREEMGVPIGMTLMNTVGDRTVLLILDNCEHLITACATFAADLLRACPAARILATSREPLRVPGETAWRVPSLSVPDPAWALTAARALESEAVQLFVDRARLRSPGFALTDEQAAPVGAICRRLDGMPLALELAAARVTALPVAQLATRLDDALRLLTVGERTAALRHQTLRTALDWGHDLLTADERAVLRRLAVFAGGCDLEAAEAVCAGGDVAREAVLPLLAQLVDKSLVQMEEQGTRGRYRLLEVVRQYARERLNASGEAEHVAQAHADWFHALAVQASPGLNSGEMAAWLERLEAEHDNLRAALRWFLDQRQVESGLRIGASIYLFWYARGYLREGRGWLEAFLALAPSAALSPSGMTTLLFVKYCAGRLAMYQGDYDGAETLLREALLVARASGHQRYIGYALTQLGHLALFQRDFATAREWYAEGLQVRQAQGDREGVAIMTGSLGRVALYERDFARARALLEECLVTFRAIAANTETINVLCDLGQVAIEEGNLALAHDYFTEGLALCEERNIRQGAPHCLEGFAILSAVRQQHERALRLAGAATALREAINAPLPPVVHARLTDAIARSRHALGEAESAAIEGAGRRMPLADAIAEALATAPDEAHVSSGGRAAKQRYGGLTARERAIVAAVAQGRSNREIADTLFIAEKTVEWHVGNCLRKRGFRTRAELAVWAVATGIVPAPPAS
ncbi:MAG: LuxR C-terminal-related transcriptional regulator [Thermomicrobiales bacterium]